MANTATAINEETIRAEVEAVSGGKQTVLFTAKGQASHFNVIPRFNLEDIHPSLGTGPHPAFLVNGVVKERILIGTYQAVIRDGEALSLPEQDPAVNVNFDEARAACSAAGEGHHLMTNWEWAAIALWCAKNGFGQLRGNTEHGKSHLAAHETGAICPTSSRTYTGTGPDAWRHDGTPYGIADLVGNVWEWIAGLKTKSGRIMMPADNAFAMPEESWPDTGARIDFHEEHGMQISDQVTEEGWDGETFAEVGIADGYTPPIALRQALLCPTAGLDLPGHFWADNAEKFEGLPIRGGGWGNGSGAGLAALFLSCERSLADSVVGFRPAFIE